MRVRQFAIRRRESAESASARLLPSRCAQRTAFTLIEMLLVLAVVTLLTAVAMPALTRWQRGTEVSRAAADLRDDLLRSRVLAIREAVTVSFAQMPNGRAYTLTTTDSLDQIISSNKTTLPEEISFDESAPDYGSTESLGEPTPLVVLRADGTGTDAVIRLRDARGDRASIVVDRLTGSVRSMEGDAR
ncbi:MAG: prepilin-type N-terminal cleavage/methylation domain-containing protein [Porticoccaceae bacterium]|jgi:prepilin-type N-terminal cleavage/methylation domain-containing protein